MKNNSKRQGLNKYFYIFFLVLIVSISPTFAAESGTLGENYTVWADIYNGSVYFDATSANLTIYDPQETILYNNVAMSEVETGVYKYVFTPNQTGQYYASVQFHNGSGLVATASDSFTIKDDNMNFLAIIIGFIGISFLLFYASHNIKTEKLPKGRIAEKIMLYFFAVINLLFLFFLMWAQSTQSGTLAIFETLFESHFILAMIMLVIIMFSFVGYFLYQYFKKAVGDAKL